MCYSTYVNKSLRDLASDYDAEIDWDAFVLLYRQRVKALDAANVGKAFDDFPPIKIPEGMDKQLLEYGGPGAKEIAELRWQYFLSLQESLRIEKQSVCLEISKLQKEYDEKPSGGILKKIKSRQENKIPKIDEKIEKAGQAAEAAKADPIMSSVEHDGYRIFPLYFAPVVIQRGSRRVIVPMRYQVKPTYGVDFLPHKVPLYNARRDSIFPNPLKTWKPLFGKTHAIFSYTRFFESVEYDGGNAEIVIWPKGFDRMHAACLYSEFNHPVLGVFRSFAIVTTDPPIEIEKAGHDRCPVFISHDVVFDWLNPRGQNPEDLRFLDGLLDIKEPVIYEWKYVKPELNV